MNGDPDWNQWRGRVDATLTGLSRTVGEIDVKTDGLVEAVGRMESSRVEVAAELARTRENERASRLSRQAWRLTGASVIGAGIVTVVAAFAHLHY